MPTTAAADDDAMPVPTGAPVIEMVTVEFSSTIPMSGYTACKDITVAEQGYLAESAAISMGLGSISTSTVVWESCADGSSRLRRRLLSAGEVGVTLKTTLLASSDLADNAYTLYSDTLATNAASGAFVVTWIPSTRPLAPLRLPTLTCRGPSPPPIP
jgi:hypothetical protein